MLRAIRNTFFWLHLFAGLLAGVVIFIMSFTGVAIAYELQMRRAALSDYWQEPAVTEQRIAVPGLVQIASDSPLAGGAKAASVKLYPERAAPAEVRFAGNKTLYVNPYTAAVLGDGKGKMDSFITFNKELHRWLVLQGDYRTWGRWVTGVANAIFLFIIVSGLYLWWPRHWTKMALKSVLLIRPSLRGKPRDWNWHNAFGFWAAIPLFFVVASALPISFGKLSTRIDNIGKPAVAPAPKLSTPPAEAGASPGELYDGVEYALADARARPGWTMMTLALPKNASETLSVTLDTGNGRQPQYQRTIEYDRTGVVVAEKGFEDLHQGAQMRRTLRFMHTGEVSGFWGQTVAMLATAASLVLVYTGFALSWRRFRPRKRKAQVA